MLAEELLSLAEWVERHVLGARSEFENFCTTLEHNARQQNKQPVQPHFDQLSSKLMTMPVQQLSAEQRALLEKRGVLKYLAESGRAHFKRVMEQDGYDPATAAQDGRAAWQALQTLSQELTQVRNGIVGLGIEESGARRDDGSFVTRVRFTGEASISNISDLKKWAADWHVIGHGLAAAAGERPEDIQIVGASRGSIVLWISGTLLVTGALAIMARHACTVTLNVVQALSAIEQLRHTKVTNQQVEEILKENLKTVQANGKNEIVDEVIQHLGTRVNAEARSKLEKSVEKYLEFTQKGGEIDMLAPPTAAVATDDEQMSAKVAELRQIIEETRKLRDSLPQLIEGWEDLG